MSSNVGQGLYLEGPRVWKGAWLLTCPASTTNFFDAALAVLLPAALSGDSGVWAATLAA